MPQALSSYFLFLGNNMPHPDLNNYIEFHWLASDLELFKIISLLLLDVFVFSWYAYSGYTLCAR